VRDIGTPTAGTLINLEQFLARISNNEASSLSESIFHNHHVEFKDPTTDAVVCFHILNRSDLRQGVKDKYIGFR